MTPEPASSAKPDQHEAAAALQVERHGIDFIPADQRFFRPRRLAWMWSGATLNVGFLVYGALVMSFGLSVFQAVAVILIGNLSYLMLGLASLQGPTTGTTGLTISRLFFGPNGNRFVSFFNWVTQVGFEIEDLYLVIALALALGGTTISGSSAGVKILVIILALAVQFVLPFFGHPLLTRVLRILAYLFVVVFIVMAILLFVHGHFARVTHHASWAVWTTGLALIVSAGGLGWTSNGNDYSRYLPADTSPRRTFWAATLGGAVPSIVLELLGVAAYAASAKSVTATAVPTVFATWFKYPFLIFAIMQMFCVSAVNMYSSGVTLQAIGLNVRRWQAVCVDTVIVAVVTTLVVFKGNFYADLSGFFLYIIVWLAPWFTILVVDWGLHRWRYQMSHIAERKTFSFLTASGFGWPAVAAQALGMIAVLMWLNAAFAVPSWEGPLSLHVPGLKDGDLSIFLGCAVSAVAYWLLARAYDRRHRVDAASELRQDSDEVTVSSPS